MHRSSVSAARRVVRVRPVCRLFAAALAAVPLAAARADDLPAETPARAEAIEVLARGYAAPIAHATPQILYAESEDIARRQSVNVADVLSEFPGVHVLTDGPRGQFSRIFVRGAQATQTLVLVDGIPQNDATTGGSFDFNDLSTAAVERVGLLSGSYGVLYGSEAIGGVVAVETKRGLGDFRGFARFEGGSFRSHREIVGTGGGDDRFDFHLTLAQEGTDGDGRNESFRSNEITTRMGFALGRGLRADWSLRAVASKAASPYDFPAFGSSVVPEDSNIDRTRDTLSTGLTLTHDWCEALQTRLTGSLFHADSVFDNRTDGPELIDPDFTPGTGDEFTTVRDELLSTNDAKDRRLRLASTARLAKWLGWRDTKSGGVEIDVTAGAETLRQSSDSRSTFANFGAAGTTTSSIDRTLDTDSTFGLVETRLPAFGPIVGGVVSVGLRRDRHETFGGESSPYAGLRFDVGPTDTTVRASWGQGFRAPKPVELDDPSAGNTDLGPETSESFDVGVSQLLLNGALDVGVTGFRLDVDDLIAFDGTATSPTRPFGQLVNLGSARTTGVEFSAKADAGRGFTVRSAFTAQNPRDRDTGAPLPNRPRHIGSAGVAWTRGAFSASLDGQWTSAYARDGGLYSSPNGDARRHPGRRAILTLGASWRHSANTSFFARIENLTDDEWVATNTSAAGSGRGVFAGVQFDF